MLGNYYAERAFNQAKNLDERARAGEIDAARELFSGLREEADRLRVALDGYQDSLG
jgi:hypothetical protein